jgi:hypothetical protein
MSYGSPLKTSDEAAGILHYSGGANLAMNLFASTPSLHQPQGPAGSMAAGASELGANPMDIRLGHPAIAQWLQQAQQMQQQQQRSQSPVKAEPIDGGASPHSGHSSEYAAL